jgi:predicted DNA-binding transcriptional regulator YafY
MLATWRPSEPVEPAESRRAREGWLTRRVAFDDEEQALFVALGFGARAEVVEPKALRQRRERELAAAVARLGRCTARSLPLLPPPQ